MNEQLKVLVVDDDRRMVRTICDILRVKGHSAEPAYSGEEAMERVKIEAPDCVLMDLKMEGIDGIETLKLLKGMVPGLPVVLMSAYATEEQVEEAKRAGAYSLLTKPIDIQMVISFLSLMRKQESILIVDDDPAFGKTLKDILQVRGCRVVTETAAEKVLGHMEHDYKLLVVLDLNLGAKDGVEVMKEIRAKYPTKPVVLITGYRDDMAKSIMKGRQIGAYTCLYKPFEADDLFRIIDEVRQAKLKAFIGGPYEQDVAAPG